MSRIFKKPMLVAGVAAGLALATITGAGIVSAATDSSSDGSTGLIDKLAAKFNLNKTDVKAVFDEDKATHEAVRQKALDDRLSQAVTDKKITAEQKDKIVAKQAELKAAHEAEQAAMKDKTDAERRAARETQRAELEKWAKDNGIPLEYVRPMGGGHGPGGPGGPGPGQAM